MADQPPENVLEVDDSVHGAASEDAKGVGLEIVQLKVAIDPPLDPPSVSSSELTPDWRRKFGWLFCEWLNRLERRSWLGAVRM